MVVKASTPPYIVNHIWPWCTYFLGYGQCSEGGGSVSEANYFKAYVGHICIGEIEHDEVAGDVAQKDGVQ